MPNPPSLASLRDWFSVGGGLQEDTRAWQREQAGMAGQLGVPAPAPVQGGGFREIFSGLIEGAKAAAPDPSRAATLGKTFGLMKEGLTGLMPPQPAQAQEQPTPPPTPITQSSGRGLVNEAISSAIDTDTEIERIMTAGTNGEETGFKQWWNSDAGKIRKTAFFDSMVQIGAGMAGVPAGSGNLSSVGRGIQRAAGSYDRALTRHHVGQFRDQLQARIDTELAKPNPNQADILQWQAAMVDPSNYGRLASRGSRFLEQVALKRISPPPTAKMLQENTAFENKWKRFTASEKEQFRDPANHEQILWQDMLTPGGQQAKFLKYLDYRNYIQLPKDDSAYVERLSQLADQLEQAGNAEAARAVSGMAVKSGAERHRAPAGYSDEATQFLEAIGSVTRVDE